MTRIHRYREAAYEKAFAELLSCKHLYQSVQVDPKFIGVELFAFADTFGKSRPLAAILNERATLPLAITTQSGQQMVFAQSDGFGISIANFETWCSICENRKPFAVLGAAKHSRGAPAEVLEKATIDEVFFLNCVCQSCQDGNVHFIIRRQALKLTLVGRSPVETINAPSFIPKAVRGHYSNAVIAHNSGQTLAAIFLLRTFIEQFWVHLGLRSEGERIAGDELGRRYSRTLPEEIRSRFPSLGDHYELLSARIHEANADAAQFDKSLEAITEHFDARRLYKVPNDRGTCSAASVAPASPSPTE